MLRQLGDLRCAPKTPELAAPASRGKAQGRQKDKFSVQQILATPSAEVLISELAAAGPLEERPEFLLGALQGPPLVAWGRSDQSLATAAMLEKAKVLLDGLNWGLRGASGY